MKVAAVIFDLDGTITRPYLDFDRIRAEIGQIAGPILEAMARMTADQRRRAESILQRHEQEAAEHSQLNPHVTETLERLRRQRRRLAIVTRNCRQSVLFVCRKHRLEFDSIATRETGPVKPDPFGVLCVCRQMQVRPAEAVVVGDYLFDLISARRAGAKGVLYRSQPNAADYEAEADFVIDDLGQLSEVIAALEGSDRDAVSGKRPGEIKALEGSDRDTVSGKRPEEIKALEGSDGDTERSQDAPPGARPDPAL